MKRKNKSVKLSYQLLQMQRIRFSDARNQTVELKFKQKQIVASSILEEILKNVQRSIDYSCLLFKEIEMLVSRINKFDIEYFQSDQQNECRGESYTCQTEPIKFNQFSFDFKVKPERSMGCNVSNQFNISGMKMARWSKSKTKSCDVFTNSKSLEKYKQQREAKKRCTKNQIFPLIIQNQRNSEDYSEDYSQQIEKLLRRRNELFLRNKLEVNLISSSTTTKQSLTDRKQKKMYYHNDEGQAIEIAPMHTPRQLSQRLDLQIKNLHGKTIYGGLKKKPIVQYSAGKKTKRRKDDYNGETCIIIQQMKQMQNYTQSLINNSVIKLKKGVKLKLNRDFDPNQLNLPQIR